MNSMRTWMCLGLSGALIVTTATRSTEDTKRSKGVFSSLRVGQSISLKDEGSAFSITTFEPELPQSHKVVEVGSDYIVVRDIAEITDTLVPIYSIKSIVKVKTKAQ